LCIKYKLCDIHVLTICLEQQFSHYNVSISAGVKGTNIMKEVIGIEWEQLDVKTDPEPTLWQRLEALSGNSLTSRQTLSQHYDWGWRHWVGTAWHQDRPRVTLQVCLGPTLPGGSRTFRIQSVFLAHICITWLQFRLILPHLFGYTSTWKLQKNPVQLLLKVRAWTLTWFASAREEDP